MEKEYYVANEVGEDPRGPYTIDKLKELAQEGVVTKDTMYYHEERQMWVLIKSNDFLSDHLFAPKKALSLKKLEPSPEQSKQKSTKKPSNKEKKSEPPKVAIQEIIDAAEGKVQNVDKEKQERSEIAREKACNLNMYILILTLWLTSAVHIYAEWEALTDIYTTEKYAELLQHPFLVSSGVSLFMSIFLVLGLTNLFGLVRTWLIFGAGFMGYYYWSFSEDKFFYGFCIGNIIVFFMSLFTRRRYILILASAGFVSYVLWAMVKLDYIPPFLTEFLPSS